MEGGIVLKSTCVVKHSERKQAQAISWKEVWTGNLSHSPFVHYWLFRFLFHHEYLFTFFHFTWIFFTINFTLPWPSQNCRCLVFRKYPCVLSSADLHDMLFMSFLNMFIKMLSKSKHKGEPCSTQQDMYHLPLWKIFIIIHYAFFPPGNCFSVYMSVLLSVAIWLYKQNFMR